MSQRTERILLAIREVVTTPTKRDVQLRVGPSDLGDPCNYCLGSKMAGVKPKRSFSMYPWLGSAIHKLIEWATEWKRFKLIDGVNNMAWAVFGHPAAVSELYIEKAIFIPGYGWCPAHIDYVFPNEGCIVDWKSSSRKKVKSYKVHGVPIENVGQTLLYLDAAKKYGYNVESAVLVFIPRDAADVSEMWAYEVFHDESEVKSIIDRAAAIWKWVEAGRWEELDKDPHCMNCNPGYFS